MFDFYFAQWPCRAYFFRPSRASAFRLPGANHGLAAANHRLVGANYRLVGPYHRLLPPNDKLPKFVSGKGGYVDAKTEPVIAEMEGAQKNLSSCRQEDRFL